MALMKFTNETYLSKPLLGWNRKRIRLERDYSARNNSLAWERCRVHGDGQINGTIRFQMGYRPLT